VFGHRPSKLSVRAVVLAGGGLLWDAPESDPAADDDDGEGTAGVLAPV
jgi:hypothetical protein